MTLTWNLEEGKLKNWKSKMLTRKGSLAFCSPRMRMYEWILCVTQGQDLSNDFNLLPSCPSQSYYCRKWGCLREETWGCRVVRNAERQSLCGNHLGREAKLTKQTQWQLKFIRQLEPAPSKQSSSTCIVKKQGQPGKRKQREIKRSTLALFREDLPGH